MNINFTRQNFYIRLILYKCKKIYMQPLPIELDIMFLNLSLKNLLKTNCVLKNQQ